MTRSQAEMERRYDDLKSGAAYAKPTPPANPSPLLTSLVDWIEAQADEECPDRCCANGTPKRDCPACTAKYEAQRQQVHARAAAAPTASERADILLNNHEMPNGDHIFDLLLEDHIVSYVWYRCIDWVLWRQAHGKPVKRCGTADDCPAAIDARYSQARALSSNRANYRAAATDADMALLCKGEMIEKWERTPKEEAELNEETDLMISIFEEIEAHFDRKATA